MTVELTRILRQLYSSHNIYMTSSRSPVATDEPYFELALEQFCIPIVAVTGVLSSAFWECPPCADPHTCVVIDLSQAKMCIALPSCLLSVFVCTETVQHSVQS